MNINQLSIVSGLQKVSDLPGVGRSLHSKLKEMGVETCSQLRCISLPKLQENFGPKTGTSLHKHCRGLDDRAVKNEHERQSVSAEINYGIRFEGVRAEAILKIK